MVELSAMLAARNIKGECPDNVEIERDSRPEPEWRLKSFVLRDVMSGSSAGTMEEGRRKIQLGIQKGQAVRPFSTSLNVVVRSEDYRVESKILVENG